MLKFYFNASLNGASALTTCNSLTTELKLGEHRPAPAANQILLHAPVLSGQQSKVMSISGLVLLHCQTSRPIVY